MKKILVMLTNVSQYSEEKEKTGLWLAEACEFVYDVQKAGFEVNYASVNGGTVPLDPRSMKKIYRSKEVDEVYESKDFQDRALKNSLSIQQIDANQYFAIYFTGGHGVLWDFPDNPQIGGVVIEIYEKNGYVLSVCHGLARLVHLKLKKQQYLISGKKITGFTNAEEVLSGKLKKVPFLTEKEAKKAGTHFVQKLPFMSHAVRDGRLITGENPMSGHAVAQLLIEGVGK